MKVKDVPPPGPKGPRAPRPTNVPGRVLAYLEARPDEVFRFRDDEIVRALDLPAATVRHALWSLAHDGFAGKARLKRGVWYGSHAAIEALVTAADAAGAFCEPL